MKPFHLLSILLISSLGTLVYSDTFFCTFHFDDYRFIVDNFAIRDILNLHNIWHYFHGRFLTFLSIALNYHFSGLDVFGYHLFNLMVHLVTSVLVWWLTFLTLSTPAMKDLPVGGAGDKITQHAGIISLFTGLIFVSHPLQTEAVTNIWQRAASMMALFYLASLCFYVKSRLLVIGAGSKLAPANVYFICSLLTAVLAMFTKENAVTLPLMVLFYEFSFLKTDGPMDWKYITPFLLAIFIIPVTFLFIKSQTFQEMHGNLSLAGSTITPMHYFLTQFRVMLTYVRLVFFPLNQNLDYDYPVYKNIFELPVFTGFLFLMAVFYLALRLFSKYRLVSFSIFWFFLTLLIPESSFWAMGDVISEHRLYLPLVGGSMFIVGGMYYLWGKNSMRFMVIALIMIMTCNSALTYQRNKVWKDDISLWEDVVRKSPYKARPYNNLGFAYASQGKFNQAMLDFKKAIEINPDYGDAYSNLATSYLGQGHFIQAIADYNKAIEFNPGYTRAYSGRAKAYYFLKEYDKAWGDVHKIEEIGTPLDDARISILVKSLSGIKRF